MKKSEYLILKKFLDGKIKEIKNNPEQARLELVNAGIFTEKGNLRKRYRDI